MHRKLIFLQLLLCIISLWNNILEASSYGPSLLFHKPYTNSPYLSDFFINFTAGQTDQAYNKNGQTVPFLQVYGSEDLLRRFIDSSIPKNDIESIGTIDFTGTFNFQRMNLSYVKNIFHDLFLQISTSAQNLSINDIALDIHLDETLTMKELQALAVFESKIPKNINSSGLYSTAIDIGYNRIFTNFENIQFLHLYLKAGFGAPQWLYGHNLTILQYPLSGNITCTYPLTAIVACGISKYINVGAYGLMVPFQPVQLSAPVNATTSHNQLLLMEEARIQVNPKPVFSTVFYVEAHDFVSNLMITAGYGYAYGMKWNISSYNQIEFPNTLINDTPILDSWSISSLFFQLDYNFISEKSAAIPTLSLFFVMPIAGSLYPKIYAVGGACNLAFTYKF